ncbi:MAG: cyclase family protein [Oscillospiraceae bacterium]|nr:cyclase family protein [Oscillospiraceae bacterium]
MKIFDITRSLQDAPLYPGSAPAQITAISAIADGALYSESLVTASSHLGTHADAFSHFLPDGAAIDAMPLENYCGACRVISVEADELIRAEQLKGRFGGVARIVLRSGGAFLCEQAASYIAACGVKLLVTDALSVGPADNEAEVHTILMRGGVAIVENADLSAVPDGDYLIFAFPAKIAGCDGAPVRAVLLQSDDADGDGAEIEKTLEAVPQVDEVTEAAE